VTFCCGFFCISATLIALLSIAAFPVSYNLIPKHFKIENAFFSFANCGLFTANSQFFLMIFTQA
jgi:hypothetical protein